MSLNKLSFPVMLLVGAVAIVAVFLAGYQTPAKAQDAPAPQTFTIQAGANGAGNTEVLAFAPQSVQVHRGDTVNWAIAGFHNVRLGDEVLETVVMAEVDGAMMPTFNSAVVLPNVENGATYTGGTANSGLPQPGTSPIFSLVMDVEPGTYSYVCDVHPGMAGVIEVVDDATAVPAPGEVAAQGQIELLSTLGAGMGADLELEMQSLSPDAPAGMVQAGSGNTGRLTINQFYPFTVTINAGESVTWTVPADSIEPHLVSWPPVRGQDVQVIAAEGQPPIFAMGPTLLPLTPTDSTVTAGQPFASGMLTPGQSYTLTFSDPGAYPFTCNIHPGMNGVVVVQAAE